MASQKRRRAGSRKPPARAGKAGAQPAKTAAGGDPSARPVPQQVRLLPPSFLEAEPWLWLELLLRTSAPPRAALFTLAPFPGEPCAPLPGDRYQIQPFVAPRLKSAGLVEVHFFSEAGEPLTTVSRLLIELGNK